MNKFLTKLFTKGQNNSILLPDRSNFSFRGNWLGVHYNSIMDKFHVGDFSSAIYQIVVEFDSNEKETMQLSVVARPDRAVANIFGRSSINAELIDISVTVDASICYIRVEPKARGYTGAKLIFPIPNKVTNRVLNFLIIFNNRCYNLTCNCLLFSNYT